MVIFPNLFDQFITKKNIVHTYLFILSFGFISGSKFSQSISPVDHYSFSSVLQSFPNLLVHVVIWFHQFFPPISGKYGKIHHFSWENMERSTIFHGKIWKDPPFFMGKYGKIHHFSWENMERSTIFHGKIWKDPPFFMGNYGKIHHFSWETVSRHTWKMFYLWFFGRFEIKNHQNQNARIFFLLGFVSRMYSSLIISFSLCHSATSF